MTSPKRALPNDLLISGIILVMTGGIFLLDRIANTGWITFLVFPVAGLMFIASSIKRKSTGWMIGGLMIVWIGSAIYFLLQNQFENAYEIRLGAIGLAGGVVWLLAAFLPSAFPKPVQWWALIPGSILLAVGWGFQTSPVDYFFMICLSLGLLGLAFLLWGISERLFGLIIPGCILITIGAGLWLAWGNPDIVNSMARIAVMLGVFSFGWFMITTFSRLAIPKSAWWALIPGGILAVTSWGLYIGADPSNALVFIGNTGSVAVLAFGFYLILMRNSMDH